MASQGSLNGLTSKFGGRTPVRIHFLDNSSKIFLVEPHHTTKDILQMVLEKCEVKKEHADYVLPFFALYESKENSSIDGSLNIDSPILPIIQSWGPDNTEAKLLFMIRLYIPSLNGLQYVDVVARRLNLVTADTSDYTATMNLEKYLLNAEVIDPSLLHLQYIQAVYNVITGAYPTSEDQALTLGSLHFLLKFGEYKPNVHVPGFLENRIVEFIPIRLLKRGKKPIDEWESDLLQAVKSLSYDKSLKADFYDESNQQERITHWELKYLHIIYKNPLYGCTFFRSNQRSTRFTPENPILAIHNLGIIILDKQRNVHKKYHMAEISEWGYKPEVMFNFQVKSNGDLEAFVEFSLRDGKVISDLLTDYALAYIKERESEDLRAKISAPPKPKTVPLPDASPAHRRMSNATKMKSPSNASKAKYAIKIQALFRGYILRMKWLREDCATLIQATFRGYVTRIKVGQMIVDLMENGDLVVED